MRMQGFAMADGMVDGDTVVQFHDAATSAGFNSYAQDRPSFCGNQQTRDLPYGSPADWIVE